jgi:hypothetical protein
MRAEANEDTTHGPFTGAVPPMGHGARVRPRRAVVEGEERRRGGEDAGGGE